MKVYVVMHDDVTDEQCWVDSIYANEGDAIKRRDEISQEVFRFVKDRNVSIYIDEQEVLSEFTPEQEAVNGHP